MDDKDDLIQNEQHFRHIQETQGAPEVNETVSKFNHLDVLNQTLKTMAIMKLDPFVQNVMTIKITSPLYNGGFARSNMSIALELGATINDVDQAEVYGVNAVSEFLESATLNDAIDKFNTDITVEKAVKDMGNSNS